MRPNSPSVISRKYRKTVYFQERRVFVKSSPDNPSPPPEPRGFVNLSIPLQTAQTTETLNVVATVALPKLQISQNCTYAKMEENPPVGAEKQSKKREANPDFDQIPSKKSVDTAKLDPSAYSPIGAHRSIEDELANRVLSDISEESSEVSEEGTFAEMADGERTPTSTRPSSSICSFGADMPEASPERPADLPLSVEIPEPADYMRRLQHQGSASPLMSQLSVGSSAASNVIHSPSRPKEIEITAVIRSGQTTPVGHGAQTPVDLSESSEVGQSGRSPGKSPKSARKDRSKPNVVPDTGFENLMAEVERAKLDFQTRMKELTDLNARLENVADTKELNVPTPLVNGGLDLPRSGAYMKSPSKIDLDDIDRQYEGIEPEWESEYQNGPETYLLALRDANMAARLRDYRRLLFGGEPSIAEKGMINELSRDISIRERRRYTDLVKTDKDLQNVEENLEVRLQKVFGKGGVPLRRIRGPEVPPAIFQPVEGSSSGEIFVLFC